MLTFSLRSLVAHRLRLLLTVAAVTLGVAFVSGTFVLSDTMTSAFDQFFSDLNKGTDVTVRSQTAFNNPHSSGQGVPLDEALVDTVRKVPGVQAAEGSVSGYALVIDKSGKAIQPAGPPTLGVDMNPDAKTSGEFSLREGRAPASPTEVVLDAGTASKAGYALGDHVHVVFADGHGEFTLVGIVGFGSSNSLAGATLAAFEPHTAQKLLGRPGKVDSIEVKAAHAVNAVELRDRVAAVLPDGVEAVTSAQVADESAASVRDGLKMFTTFLLAFAAISLVVGSFVIWNTFNVLVAQRRREIALLRAVGSSRRQVLGGIVTEATVVGAVAAAAGLALGVGLALGIKALLGAMGIDMPDTSAVIAGRTVIAALAVGVGITVAAALVPALGATRVAPVEALRQSSAEANRLSMPRIAAGTVLLTAGAAGLVSASITPDQLQLTGLSTIAAFAGLVLVGPVLARGLAAVASRSRRGSGWRLAGRAVGRAPQRASATALALTIGLAVVCAMTVTATSMKASVADAVAGGIRSDLVVRPASAVSGISPAAATVLRERNDVESVTELRTTAVKVGDRVTMAVGLAPEGLNKALNLGVADGSLTDFRDGTVLVSTNEARTHNLRVGDELTVTFSETGEHHLRVAGTYKRDTVVGAGYVVTLADFSKNVTSTLDDGILVSATPGTDVATWKGEVTEALAAYPNAHVHDPAGFTKERQAHVDQMLGLVSVLLLLAVVVAVLGVINTLALSVVERTRELGLLRAVGGSRRQVRGMVRRESVLMAVLGALAGIGLGTAAGVALARALASQGISSLSVPVPMLICYVAIAAIVGVFAAVGPARRASRIDVLKALAVD